MNWQYFLAGIVYIAIPALVLIMLAGELGRLAFKRTAKWRRRRAYERRMPSGFTIDWVIEPDGWINCNERMPPDGEVVLTRDSNGIVRLKRNGHVWMLPDNSMFVVREPTHWKSYRKPSEGK